MPEFNKLDALWEQASVESVDFVEKHLGEVLVFSDESRFLHFVVQKIKEQKTGGKFLSFTAQNEVNELDARFTRIIHISKESFRSQADAWKGNYPVNDLCSDVTPHPNTFDVYDVIKRFPASKISFVALIHISGGVSEVAEIILKKIEKYLEPKVLVLFGELIGYPNWRNGQYRAWTEIAKNHGIKFRYLGFYNHQALVEITERQMPDAEDAES